MSYSSYRKEVVCFYLTLKRPMAIANGPGFIQVREEPVPWLWQSDWGDGYKLLKDEYFALNKNLVAIQATQEIGKPVANMDFLTHAFEVAMVDRGEKDRHEINPESDRVILRNSDPVPLRSILRMATVLLPGRKRNRRKDISDAFDRCLEALSHVERAYILTAHDPNYELTNRVSCASSCALSILQIGRAKWTSPRIFLINMQVGLEHTYIDQLDSAKMDEMFARYSLASNDNVLVNAGTWLYKANRSLEVEGDFSSTIL